MRLTAVLRIYEMMFNLFFKKNHHLDQMLKKIWKNIIGVIFFDHSIRGIVSVSIVMEHILIDNFC